MAREERIELVPGTHECGVVKERAHRTSDDLGVPEVNRARHGDDGSGAERGRRSENGADVPGILQGVEHDDAGLPGEREIGEPSARDLGDGEHALRRVGLGRAGEVPLVDVDQVGADAVRRFQQDRASRGTGELWRDEDAADRQRGREKLLDGAHALGDEETLALAGPPPPEVAG